MASLNLATKLQNHRVLRPDHQLDEHELRAFIKFLGAYGLIKDDSSNLFRSLGRESFPEAFRKRSREIPIDFVVQDRVVAKKVVGRSCAITENPATSQILNFSTTTLVYDYGVNPFEFYLNGKGTNEIEKMDYITRQVQAIEEDVLQELDVDCAAAIIANKTPSTAYSPQTPFNLIGDDMQVLLAKRHQYFQYIEFLMKIHEFSGGNVNVLGEGLQSEIVREYLETTQRVDQTQGVTTSNEGWRVAGKTFYESKNLIPVVGVDTRSILNKPSTFGIAFRNPQPFEAKAKYDIGFFDTTGPLPISGIDMGIQTKVKCVGGDDILELNQLSVDYTIITAYNSDPANVPSATFEAHLLKV